MRGSVVQVLRFAGQTSYMPQVSRPGPLLWIHERRQGSGSGKFLIFKADFIVIPLFGKPVMDFVDRTLKCIDCGAEFIFTAGEQLFFHEKQFKNDPKHCKQCKAKRAKGAAQGPSRDSDELFGVRSGDHRAVQAHPGQARALPFLLPETAARSPSQRPYPAMSQITDPESTPAPN